jgi:glucokinase
VLAEFVTATPTEPDALIDTVVAAIDTVTGLAGAADTVASAVGLGVAGYIDLGGVARRAPNLAVAVDLDLAGPVGAATGLPVVVDNDVNCAARAVARVDAPGASPLVVITLGTGIGGALVLDGEVVRGHRGYAGEWGHMIVEPDGPRCVCGQRGCWERVASGSGLAHLARLAVAAGDGGSIIAAAGSSGAISGPLVTTLAAQGDPDALAVLDTFAEWVALGLVNVINIVDPEVIVLGGGLVTEGDRLAVRVREALARHVAHSGLQSVEVALASAGAAAGAVGAALLAGSTPAAR